jgi:hypothetical protein
MNTEIEGVGGRLKGELEEELEEDHGRDTIGTATVVASKRHHRVCYGDGGAAQCPWPSGQAQHHTWGRRRGCRHHPTGEDSGDATADTKKCGRNPSEIEPEQIEPQGRDRPRRRAEEMATNGGKSDESPWSDGRA